MYNTTHILHTYCIYICYLAAYIRHVYSIHTAYVHMLHMYAARVLHTQYIHIACMRVHKNWFSTILMPYKHMKKCMQFVCNCLHAACILYINNCMNAAHNNCTHLAYMRPHQKWHHMLINAYACHICLE